MERYDVVLVKFPFTDYSTSKLRPAIIVSKDNSRPDIIVSFISSALPLQENEDEYTITKNHAAFPKTGLRVDSVFKMRKLATLDQKVIIGKIGHIESSLQIILDTLLKAALGLR